MAFLLTQQLFFRFSTISVDNTRIIFRSAAGLELARQPRVASREVFMAGQGKRTAYLVVKTGAEPDLLSLRSEDLVTLERARKLLLQRSAP